jgi:hypothetical protein
MKTLYFAVWLFTPSSLLAQGLPGLMEQSIIQRQTEANTERVIERIHTPPEPSPPAIPSLVPDNSKVIEPLPPLTAPSQLGDAIAAPGMTPERADPAELERLTRPDFAKAGEGAHSSECNRKLAIQAKVIKLQRQKIMELQAALKKQGG